MKAIYTIEATTEARELLEPPKTGDRVSVAVLREGANPWEARAVWGVVVETDGFNARVEYELPAGHVAL